MMCHLANGQCDCIAYVCLRRFIKAQKIPIKDLTGLHRAAAVMLIRLNRSSSCGGEASRAHLLRCR